MTVLERERILRDTAQRYVLGEIDYAEMTRIRHETDDRYIRKAATDHPADAGGR